MRHLTDINFDHYGDSKADQFFHQFMSVLVKLDVPLDMNHKRDLLHHEMRKSSALMIPLLKYDDTPKDDRTFEQLVGIFNRHLEHVREDQQLKKEQQAEKKGKVNSLDPKPQAQDQDQRKM